MASTAAATQLRRANVYNFVSQSGNTTITYYPLEPGPLKAGQARGPLFKYAGPEGKFDFRSKHIKQQEVPAGQLLSVALKEELEAESLAFSLFLSPVNVDASGSQTFTTCGVMTNQVGSTADLGPQGSYEIETFTGEAKFQFMPR